MATRKYNDVEIALLAMAFKRSTQTIKRWVNKSDDRLTSEKAKLTLNKQSKK